MSSYLSVQSLILIEAIVELVKKESTVHAGNVATLLEPLAISEAVAELLEAEVTFDSLLGFATACTDNATRLNLVQGMLEYAPEECKKQRFRVMRLLDEDSLNLLFQEEILLELQDELWENSDSYAFENQILNIHYKAELTEVIVENLHLRQGAKGIEFGGDFHVGSSLGGFNGKFAGLYEESGFKIADVEIDTSNYYGESEDE